MKKLTSIALRALVSGALLWVLWQQHSRTDGIWEHLRTMQNEWRWVLAGIGSIGIAISLSAWRWWLVLKPHVPTATLPFAWHATLVSGFFNITSLGTLGGDAWRIMAVRKHYPGNGVAAGLSVMIDHLAGLLGMAVIFAIVGIMALYQWPEQAAHVRTIIHQFAIVLLIGSVVLCLAVLSLSPAFVQRYGSLTPRRLRVFVNRMSAQFAPIWTSWRSFIAAVLVSVLMLSAHFFAFYCALRAVGGQADLLPVMLAMPIVDMAAALPVSISGLGVREKTFETLMHAFTGLPGGLGVSASLAGWLFTVICGLIGGLVFVLGRTAAEHEQPARTN